MFLMCFGQVKRTSSNMSAASYDQLLRQVEVLKMENSNLRQELQDNSNHLTKLETEASNMKVSTPLSLSPTGEKILQAATLLLKYSTERSGESLSTWLLDKKNCAV